MLSSALHTPKCLGLAGFHRSRSVFPSSRASAEPWAFSNHASQVNWHTRVANKRAEPEQTSCQNSLSAHALSCCCCCLISKTCKAAANTASSLSGYKSFASPCFQSAVTLWCLKSEKGSSHAGLPGLSMYLWSLEAQSWTVLTRCAMNDSVCLEQKLANRALAAHKLQESKVCPSLPSCHSHNSTHDNIARRAARAHACLTRKGKDIKSPLILSEC